MLLALVKRIYSQGGRVEDILAETLPEPFDGWLDDGMVHFETNVKTLFQRLSESQ
jgi:hypothetical protein